MRRLVVNADDFGASESINAAVIDAHQRGILTTASLMVNGSACAQAVQLAKAHPKLGVGLHLSLAFGKATLSPAEIPDLVDPVGNFSNNPVAAGMKYFFSPRCREQIGREISAQFQKFESAGLALDHVNGHLHFHLHPAVFKSILPRKNIGAMRVTRDPFWLNARIAAGRWFYRVTHAVIFRLLSERAAVMLDLSNVRYTRHVFGLLQNAQVDSAYIQALLPRLPEGDSELYSHPCLNEFRHEYEALIDPAVRAMIDRERIQLIRYADL